ncbi:MAG: hypothetical protein R3B74_14685 [Nitrospirales bacterium]|nr:hypothetical protein [Nitrospirales bacterium]
MAFDVPDLALRRSHTKLMILSCTTGPGGTIGDRRLKAAGQRFQSHSQVIVGEAGFAEYPDF